MDGNMAMILGIIAVVFVVVCVFLVDFRAVQRGACVDGRAHRHEDSSH